MGSSRQKQRRTRVTALATAAGCGIISALLATQPATAVEPAAAVQVPAQVAPAALPPMSVTSLSGGIGRPLMVPGSTVNTPVELGRGHIDALAPQLVNDQLVMTVKDDTRLHSDEIVFRTPDSVTIQVSETARQPIPDGYDFLGASGAPIWILPQTQDAELPWPGWSTEHPSMAGQFNGPVTFRLVSADGPGTLVMFHNVGFGQTKVLASTTEGLPASWTEPVPAHVHTNWAFSEPGTYILGFEARGTLTNGTRVSTGTVAYRFVVDGEPGSGSGGGSGGAGGLAGGEGTGSGSAELAKTGLDDPAALAFAGLGLGFLGFALLSPPRRARSAATQ